MVDDTASVALRIEPGQDEDAQELERLTSTLQRQLLQLEVEDVERPVEGEAPPGTRGVDVAAIGGLIITLAKSSGVLGSVVGMIQKWVAGKGSRSVKLELDGDALEVTGLSSADQQRLITAWIERHSEP
jgi:hypothetical protein